MDALIAAPDRSTRIGRRDHALLLVALQTGLRVSELTALRRQDIHIGPGAYLTCTGKGRKYRATPLNTATVAVLKAWLDEQKAKPDDPVFAGPTGQPITRDAVTRRLAHHVATAAVTCPSIATKTITPHTLRHSCAMELLRSGVDVAVIALWLGHESIRTTDIYQHADLSLKEQALARTAPPDTKPGRYQPTDTLLAFLEAL